MSTTLLSGNASTYEGVDNPSRKRKRPESAAATHQTTTNLPKLTPSSSFSSSAADEQAPASTPPNPVLEGIHREDGVSGAMSPRMQAAGDLSRLSIVEAMDEEEEEERMKKSESVGAKKRDRTPERAIGIGIDDEDEDEIGQPATKKLPRGTVSPKPQFRTIKFTRPEKSKLSLFSISKDQPSTSLSDTPPFSQPTNVAATESETSTDLWDFDFSSMTWQDDEITGHLMLDSDDDGTGINGIGFRPTPSIARQRAAQRRRQVQEWKMRQDVEERERRAERRRLQDSAFGASKEMGGVKKAVRFVV